MKIDITTIYTWEASDIEAGRVVKKSPGTTLLIGWAVHIAGPKRYLLIDPRDGAVFDTRYTKEGLAKYLTEQNYGPVGLEQTTAAKEAR